MEPAPSLFKVRLNLTRKKTSLSVWSSDKSASTQKTISLKCCKGCQSPTSSPTAWLTPTQLLATTSTTPTYRRLQDQIGLKLKCFWMFWATRKSGMAQVLLRNLWFLGFNTLHSWLFRFGFSTIKFSEKHSKDQFFHPELCLKLHIHRNKNLNWKTKADWSSNMIFD